METEFKVKRNIAKMIDMGADEAEIDTYINSTPYTLDKIKSVPVIDAQKEAEVLDFRAKTQAERAAKPKYGMWDALKETFTNPEDLAKIAKSSILGAEKVAQGATLGGYGAVADKLGLDYSGRSAELQKEAEGAGIGGINKVADIGLQFGGNITGAGAALGKAFGSKLLGAVGAGATEGAITEGFKGGSAKDIAKEAAIGGGLAGGLYGALKAVGAVRKGVSAKAQASELADVAGDINKMAINKDAQQALKRGIKASDDVAQDVILKAEQGMDTANQKVVDELDNAFQVKNIDIDNMKATSGKQYGDFMQANGAKRVDVGDILENPNIKKAYNEATTTYYDSLKGLAPDSVGALQKTKESLDDMIGTAVRGGESGKVRELTKLKNALLNRMEDVVPGYKNVRKNFADTMQIDNAIDAGRQGQIVSSEVKDVVDANKIGLKEFMLKQTENAGAIGSDLTKGILKNKNVQLFDALVGKDKTKSLVKALQEKSKELTALKGLHTTASNKILRPVEGKGLIRESLETVGSMVGSASDLLTAGAKNRYRTNLAKMLLDGGVKKRIPQTARSAAGLSTALRNNFKEEK